MADNNSPRRVAHFDDPDLEAQFEEIIQTQSQLAEGLSRSSDDERDEKDSNNIKYDEIIIDNPDDPIKPTGLTVSSAFKKFILNWNRIDNPYIAGYIVSYSSSFDGQSTWNEWVNIDVGNSSFYVHDNLDPSYDYRYKIRSYNTAGDVSSFTDIVVGGKPGKVSLSEEVVGELIGDYLADGIIDPIHLDTELYNERDAWNSTVIQTDNIEDELNKTNDTTSYTSITQNHDEITSVAVTANDNEAYISAINQTPEEISSTVAEVYPDGTANASTIQQNANEINFRVVALDSNGDATSVNAQINISQLDGDGFIYIGGDQITLDGDTNIGGSFEVTGSNVVLNADTQINGTVTIDASANPDEGLTVINEQGTTIIDGKSQMFKVWKTGTMTISAEAAKQYNWNDDITYRPALLIYILGTEDWMDGRSMCPYYVYYEENGEYSWGVQAGATKDNIYIKNHYSHSLDIRYYILKEEAI